MEYLIGGLAIVMIAAVILFFIRRRAQSRRSTVSLMLLLAKPRTLDMETLGEIVSRALGIQLNPDDPSSPRLLPASRMRRRARRGSLW